MPIIIPSQKIYNISHDKISNNKIEGVGKSYYTLNKEFGNILPKEYRFRFFNIDKDVDITTLPALYENPKYTEGFIFRKNGNYLYATLKLPIDKITRFETNTDAFQLSSHQFKSTQTIEFTDGKNITYTQFVPAQLTAQQEEGYIYFHYQVQVFYDDYIVVEDRISLVGDYYTPIETKEVIGSGTEAISFPSNELIQSTNTNLNKYVDDILGQYANGKETATVRCSIGDYYDTENGLTITPKTDSKMTFEIGDKVVPMVRNSEGVDNALSYHSDGTAKVFNVVGEKYTYDGAVWQELTLRETSEGLYYVESNPYLIFSSPEEFTLSVNTKRWDGILEYSTTTSNWYVWDGTEISSANGRLYLRGTGNTTLTNFVSNSQFNLNGSNIDCKGNIETLLDYRLVKKGIHPTMKINCFFQLFAQNSGLIGAPSLPATNLTERCYREMFINCTNLEELPLLPAKILPQECYYKMFMGCTKIKLSEYKSETYSREYRVPIRGNLIDAFSNCVGSMFSGTTGNVVTLNTKTTYYTSNKTV